jgi:hypothetical protein
MTKQIWTMAAVVAALAALMVVPAAMAAYTSPKLEVFPTASGVTIRASLSPDDDPTARVAITAPTGTQLTTTQAPGTVLGAVEALVKALDLAGADLPLQGQLVVAAPGQVAPATQTACIGSSTPLATWAMVLSAAGQTLTVPTYLLATTGAATALGPAFIVICLPPPDVPLGTPGRATFGAKVYSAALTINGVFSRASGIWLSSWVPYTPGAGTASLTGAVVAPAGIASGAVTVAARRAGKAGAVVSGIVTQGGQPRAGATVTIFGGPRASGLKRLGRVRSAGNGRFTFRAKTGTFFRANAAGAAGAAPAVCAQLAPTLGSVPCVNPTVNAFTAQSRVVRKR